MTAQASRLIPASPAEVWRVLTSREGMKAYMMGADVETDWRVGEPIVMRGEMGGKPYEDRGEVRSFEPGKRFSYTHESGPGQTHLVTVQIAPRGDATEVTVTQEAGEGVDAEADARNQGKYEETWAAMLEGVEKAAAAS